MQNENMINSDEFLEHGDHSTRLSGVSFDMRRKAVQTVKVRRGDIHIVRVGMHTSCSVCAHTKKLSSESIVTVHSACFPQALGRVYTYMCVNIVVYIRIESEPNRSTS